MGRTTVRTNSHNQPRFATAGSTCGESTVAGRSCGADRERLQFNFRNDRAALGSRLRSRLIASSARVAIDVVRSLSLTGRAP